MLSSFPSPSSELVPGIGVRYYGLMIALGVLLAVTLARRRWKAQGHDPDEIADIAVWAVPAGLIGARLWHVITDFNQHRGDEWYWPIQIWKGGLGIPGGILLGVAAGVLAARHYKIDVKSCADAMVPAIPLAQAVGRVGNYFNQELFGRPTDVPWAVEIPDPAKRPNYPNDTTFHPTFAYEALWSLGAMGVLIWLDSKKIFRRGKMLPLYLLMYFTGRLWVEQLRSDRANEILGLRVNTWTSLVMITVGLVWLNWGGALRPKDERGTPHADQVVEEPADEAADESAAADPDPDDSDDAVLDEDGVVEGGPEVDGPVAEVDVAEGDEAETGDRVDP